MNADHLGELAFRAFFEFRLIPGLRRVAAGVPIAFRPSAERAPEVIFAPEHDSQAIARIHERGGMRVVRAANEVEARLFDESDVAFDVRGCDGIGPAGLVLMDVGPAEV